MTLRHLDLFSGIGGFALAAQWAGFTTIGFAEIDTFCSKVLHKHWPHIPNYGDVRNIRDMGQLDLITGGFPCQPFSLAGKKKGQDDARYLWPYFRQIIRNHHPRFVVAENVLGLVNMGLDDIINDLEMCGYDVETFVIPACAVGAPHKRDRVWIVAYSTRERCDYGFDHPKWQHVQDHWERDITTLQTEWFGFIPRAWKNFNFKKWFGDVTDAPSERHATTGACGQSVHSEPNSQGQASDALNVTYDDGGFQNEEDQPPIPGVDDGIPFGLDRCKALGNAIVPQVAYPLLRLLALMGGMTRA